VHAKRSRRGEINPVVIVVKNVAGVSERSFSWELSAER
jgi:hypothetical protein